MSMAAGPATPSSTAPENKEPLELRVFRILAMGGALGHGAYAEKSAMDEATRGELMKLINSHRERIDREVAKLRAQSPLPPHDTLVERQCAG
jgi:hypothetical protein